MHDTAATSGIDTQALLSGAWARGLADAFSLLGLPAVFLDGGGRVLHVGLEALPLFGADMGVASRRLVLADRAAASALEAALDLAADGAPARARLGGSGLTAHVVAIPAAPGQLLARVVLLLEASDSAGAGLAEAIFARAGAPASAPH